MDLARLSASAANLQPLKYILSCEPEKNARIFRASGLGRLSEGLGRTGPRRTALAPTSSFSATRPINNTFGCDHGIAAQSILLGAREKGLAGCMIGLIQREELRKTLDIPARYEILLVIALGKPREQVVIDEVGPTGDIKYWRDSAGVHHVPKRSLQELIIG